MDRKHKVDNGPMLNAYPDSMGDTLGEIVSLLESKEMEDVFQSFYILPSLFNTDLDRGFSVIDYSLNELFASPEDLKKLQAMGIDLKLDFILNHASVLSPQFQDMIKKGEASAYKDFFINWNDFWKGFGELTEAGYIQPEKKYLSKMFFRKPGLPILMVRFPDGRKVPYWNTFYQEKRYPRLDVQDVMRETGLQYGKAAVLAERINAGLDAGKEPEQISEVTEEVKLLDFLENGCKYLGQMDLNIKSPAVWDFYEDTLSRLAAYGANIVRLDAFAYAPKEPGEKNFMNQPGTWDVLEKVNQIARKYELTLLPEIHASYEEKVYEEISARGYMTYDFFLPGLIIDALENEDGHYLAAWARELRDKKIRTVNMLGCHDGIPLLDLKGLVPEERIQNIIDTVVGRGGLVKDLHGAKNIYYQVNATYYSALGEEDEKLLLARALQLFMPGKPQIWYLDLFAGKNDHEAVSKAGSGGHKEINRTNISEEKIKEYLKKPIVQKQLSLLRFRNCFPAFGFDARMELQEEGKELKITWERENSKACLSADLRTRRFRITGSIDGKEVEVLQ